MCKRCQLKLIRPMRRAQCKVPAAHVKECMAKRCSNHAMSARSCCPDPWLVIAHRPCEFGCYECDESLRYDVDAFQHRKAWRFLSWGF